MTISLEEHVAREPDLLPCPFCGGAMLFRAALWPSDGDNDGFIHADFTTECPLVAFEDGSFDRSIIGKWNARAAIAAVREYEGAASKRHDHAFVAGPDWDGNAISIRESERAACEAMLRDAVLEIGLSESGINALRRMIAVIATRKGNGEGK